MKQFSSLDLQQRSGDIQRSALTEPVVITNHGKPRLVMVSVDEFTRLKTIANEPIPMEVRSRRPVEHRGLPLDPLGRDTGDFDAFVAEVADHALSGNDRGAIDVEIRAAERRLGLHRELAVFERKPRLLIPDNTPLSVLSLLGADALDWLFVPGAEVWVTDMVKEEATRDPALDSDIRHEQRQEMASWFARNADRINIQPTKEGEEYRKAMETWRLAGSLPELKPSGSDRGERSIFQALKAVDALVADGEAVVAIMDDRNARTAMRTMNHDLDMMTTESFVIWMAEGFAMPGADTAWQTIRMITGKNLPTLRAGDDEPVSTFKI